MCACACFSKRLVRYICSVNKQRRKNKEDGIPCVSMLSNYLSTFSFSLLVSWCCVLSLSLFFYAAVGFSIYLLSDCTCVCVCVSAFIICCVFAHSSSILFCFFFARLFNSLIYSQTKSKNGFLCACFSLFLSLYTVVVCVWSSFSLGSGWLFICLFFFFIYLCVCLLYVYHCHREKETNNRNFRWSASFHTPKGKKRHLD